MGAIDNAEAVDVSRAPAPTPGTIGEVHLGVGSGEVGRRELSAEEVLDILRIEIRERTEAAAEYSRIGQGEHASRLKAEAAALMSFIEGALGET